MDIAERKSSFQAALKSKISNVYIVERYIIFGNPYVFQDNESLHFELKQVIAKKFRVQINDVIMAGSAKLGFSISPSTLWNDIHDDSDIDIAIINENLFNYYWKDLFKFNFEIAYRTEAEEERFRSFLKYFFKGWLRPDYLPSAYPRKAEWEDFFQKLSYKKYAGRKVRGAIFRNDYFFKGYHISNIKRIRAGGNQ